MHKIYLGKILFYVCFISVIIIPGMILLPLLLLPQNYSQPMVLWWCNLVLSILKITANIDYRLHDFPGNEQPHIIIANHQSTYETLLLPILFPNCTYILKKELLWLPFFGWYLKKYGVIAIDRSKGVDALKKMKEGLQKNINEKRTIVIFPEGTRVRYGERASLKMGLKILYNEHYSFYMLRHNSGFFWSKFNLFMRSGVVDLYFKKLPNDKIKDKEVKNTIEDFFYAHYDNTNI